MIDNALEKYKHEGALDTAGGSIGRISEGVCEERLPTLPLSDDPDRSGSAMGDARTVHRQDGLHLLNIGCAEGAITKKASDLGLLSIGIDTNKPRLAKGQADTRT